MAEHVKFIRKNGKIIPIRTGKGGGSGKKGPYKPYRRGGDEGVPLSEKARMMKRSAEGDRKLASQGRKVAAVSAIGSLGIAGIAMKTKSGKLGAAAAVGGLFALTNSSFASGREMSAKDRDGYAKQFLSGRKPKRGKGIGGASDRAYSDAQWLSNMKTQKRVPKNKTGV